MQKAAVAYICRNCASSGSIVLAYSSSSSSSSNGLWSTWLFMVHLHSHQDFRGFCTVVGAAAVATCGHMQHQRGCVFTSQNCLFMAVLLDAHMVDFSSCRVCLHAYGTVLAVHRHDFLLLLYNFSCCTPYSHPCTKSHAVACYMTCHITPAGDRWRGR
jgi:hypothetical protein